MLEIRGLLEQRHACHQFVEGCTALASCPAFQVELLARQLADERLAVHKKALECVTQQQDVLAETFAEIAHAFATKRRIHLQAEEQAAARRAAVIAEEAANVANVAESAVAESSKAMEQMHSMLQSHATNCERLTETVQGATRSLSQFGNELAMSRRAETQLPMGMKTAPSLVDVSIKDRSTTPVQNRVNVQRDLTVKRSHRKDAQHLEKHRVPQGSEGLPTTNQRVSTKECVKKSSNCRSASARPGRKGLTPSNSSRYRPVTNSKPPSAQSAGSKLRASSAWPPAKHVN